MSEKRTHVSFSSMQIFLQCPYKYKLSYLDKSEQQYSIYLDFGSAVHDAINSWHREEVSLIDEFEINLRKYITENQDKYSDEQKSMDIELWLQQGRKILGKIEDFLKKNYPEYTIFDTEEDLNEKIDDCEDLTFKGFIDVILKHKTEEKYVLIDWKTTSYNWSREARGDPIKKMQLLLYKYFWCRKHNIDPKMVNVAFVLLKRTAKRNICERIGMRSTDKYIDRAVEHLNKFIYGLQIERFIKNKSSCQNCQFGRWAKDDSDCEGARKFMKTEPVACKKDKVKELLVENGEKRRKRLKDLGYKDLTQEEKKSNLNTNMMIHYIENFYRK